MRRYEGNLKSWMINMHQEQWYLTALWFSRPLIMALTVTIIWSTGINSTFETILIFLSLFITVLCVKGKLGAPDQSSAQRSEMRVEIVELRSTQKSSNLLLRHKLTPIWQVTAARCSSWTILWSKDNLHAEKKHPKIHNPKEIFSHKRILFDFKQKKYKDKEKGK